MHLLSIFGLWNCIVHGLYQRNEDSFVLYIIWHKRVGERSWITSGKASSMITLAHFHHSGTPSWIPLEFSLVLCLVEEAVVEEDRLREDTGMESFSAAAAAAFCSLCGVRMVSFVDGSWPDEMPRCMDSRSFLSCSSRIRMISENWLELVDSPADWTEVVDDEFLLSTLLPRLRLNLSKTRGRRSWFIFAFLELDKLVLDDDGLSF